MPSFDTSRPHDILTCARHNHAHLHAHHRRYNATLPTNETSEYEYVIVGSGAGGAPLAARLALSGFSVLVLEAGEDMADDIYTNVPALHFVAAEHPPMVRPVHNHALHLLIVLRHGTTMSTTILT